MTLATELTSWGRRAARYVLNVLERSEEKLVAAICEQAASLRHASDASLAETTSLLRSNWQEMPLPPQAVVVSSFALMHESIRRTLGVTLFETQLQAGLVLTRQAVAEMATGEGKTLAASLPAMLYSLAARGVHVMTVNSYLAERDHQLLEPAFDLLGISAALLREQAPPGEKRSAYNADVTFGPGHEFGFDYLRDQRAIFAASQHRLGEVWRRKLRREERPPLLNQRGFYFAVIDEADSVMIDEATTPLVLAERSPVEPEEAATHYAAMRTADTLLENRDFFEDAGRGSIVLTAAGQQRIAAPASADLLLKRPWEEYVRVALQARLRCRLGVDYVVQHSEVHIVDTNTGRIYADRSWQDGLRQAVEAREGIPITGETQAIARIARQRCFRLYPRLSGLTGTAREVRREFQKVYGLSVVTIAPRRPCQRQSLGTRFFSTGTDKWRAIMEEIQQVHDTGQPVLVGTRTIRDSNKVVEQLSVLGLEHQLLNGTQDAEEAAIIAAAGRRGAITVATNMAGRGTDIRLAPGVDRLGGLHVVVCEPHESARVDRQLIGRAARQGDPGSCSRFVSAADPVLRDHAPEFAETLRSAALARPPGRRQAWERTLARVQKRREQQAYARRRQLAEQEEQLVQLISHMSHR